MCRASSVLQGVIQQSLRRGGTSEKERRGISEGRTSTEGLKTTIPVSCSASLRPSVSSHLTMYETIQGTQSQGPEEEEEEEEWGSEDEEGGLGRIEGRERDQPGLEKGKRLVEEMMQFLKTDFELASIIYSLS